VNEDVVTRLDIGAAAEAESSSSGVSARSRESGGAAASEPMPAEGVAADGIARDSIFYEAIIAVLQRRCAAGESEEVLLCAAFAAFFAWSSPIGRLSDPRLESAVIDAVRTGGAAVTLDGSRHRGRIVHVMTEASVVEGHSRFTWRWIQRDHRRSDLVLTNQHGEVPEELLRSVAESGGQVYDLRGAYTSLNERAQALRRLMDTGDISVYHTDPYDTVAIAAAALPGVRAPIVLENHADHTYWLGLGIADIVTSNRAIGVRVCADLRGLPLRRQRVLPTPIEPVLSPVDRQTTRAKLGISADAVVAICVATPYKLYPTFDMGFAELARNVLRAIPELTLLLAGPTATGPWQELRDDFPGRFHVLGMVKNAPTLFSVADIYLDAHPISSGTALLEASAAGLPTLALHRVDAYSDVWITEAPVPDNDSYCATTLDEYIEKLRELVASPGLRHELSSTAKRHVLAVHTGEEWVESLEAVYARARSAEPARVEELVPVLPGDRLHGELHRVMHWDRDHLSFEAMIQPHVMELPRALKAELFAAWTTASSAVVQQRAELRLRVHVGWEHHREWMLRALRLTAASPRLSLSLPPARTDDYAGSLTILLDMLEEAALSVDECGRVAIEPDEIVADGLIPIACVAESLDFVGRTLEFL